MPRLALNRYWLALAIAFCLAGGAAAQTTPPAPQEHQKEQKAKSAAPEQSKQVQAKTAAPEPVPESEEASKLDDIQETFKKIAETLRDYELSPKELQALQDRISPYGIRLATEVSRLSDRLAAVKARLDQLGPPPDAKHPPENPQVTAERLAQQKDYAAIDALLKSAKLLSVRNQQLSAWIAKRQQQSFTQPLFKRWQSILNPYLWIEVVEESPHNLQQARNAIGGLFGDIGKKLPGWRAPVFWASLCALLILSVPLFGFARRRLMRESPEAQPSRLRKVLAAWWVAVVITGYVIVIGVAIGGLFEVFGVLDATTKPVLSAIFFAAVKFAAAAGLASGLLAPAHANWRLVTLDTRSARHAFGTIIAVTAIVTLGHLVILLMKAIGAEGLYRSALSGLGAIAVATVIVVMLWRDQAAECELGDILGPRVAPSRDWFGLVRILLWVAIIAVVAATLTGFMGLANFLVSQIVWVGFVVFIAVMSIILIEEAIAAGCRPTTPFGRTLIASIGLHRDSIDQIGILLSGAATVAIFIAAVLVLLAPLGIQSTDLPTYLHAAFFGFRVGDITVSLSSIIIALAIFFAGTTATRTVERWLDARFLPHTDLDIGLRNAIKTSFSYIGFILALGFALAYLGLNFEKLAIVAGALSVGIGFGLQSIVNNFVSGLIILWERVIRVGDWIVVGSDEGLVRRIHVRSTEIETFDRAAVTIPNSNLVAGVVKNYVRADRSGRIQISMPVNPAADPEKARAILLDIAKGHNLVLKDPAPFANFTSITPTAFNFDLFCFIADVANLGSVRSDLNFEIYRRFKAEGLFAAPLPGSVITLAGLDGFEPFLNKAGNPRPARD